MPRKLSREVRFALSSTPIEFQKSALSRCKTDDFRDWNLHVFYRDDYLCNGVELWRSFDQGVSFDHTSITSPNGGGDSEIEFLADDTGLTDTTTVQGVSAQPLVVSGGQMIVHGTAAGPAGSGACWMSVCIGAPVSVLYFSLFRSDSM